MTNQEWLTTISPEDWWEAVYDYLFHDYGTRFNHTRLAVIDWLQEEHKPIEMYDQVKRQMCVRWE